MRNGDGMQIDDTKKRVVIALKLTQEQYMTVLRPRVERLRNVKLAIRRGSDRG